jgi:hypothetical protein
MTTGGDEAALKLRLHWLILLWVGRLEKRLLCAVFFARVRFWQHRRFALSCNF